MDHIVIHNVHFKFNRKSGGYTYSLSKDSSDKLVNLGDTDVSDSVKTTFQRINNIDVITGIRKIKSGPNRSMKLREPISVIIVHSDTNGLRRFQYVHDSRRLTDLDTLMVRHAKTLTLATEIAAKEAATVKVTR